MKKSAVIIAALLCISLTACGKEPERPAKMIETETTVSTTETISETAAAADPRIGDIAGVWFEDGEQALSRTLTIRKDGTFVLELQGGGAMHGTVIVESEEHPDGTETLWYSFYQTSDTFWTGFRRSEEQPQDDLYSGQDGELHFIRAESLGISAETTAVTGTEAASAATTAANTTAAMTSTAPAKTTTAAATTSAKDKNGNTPNAYGYYPVTEIPQTSISVKQFDGVWYDAADPAHSIQFFDCDYLRGSFTMQNADNSLTTGKIMLEYKRNADGTENWLYNLYDKNGKYLFGVDTNTDIPFEEFGSADHKYRFTRQTQENGITHAAEEFLGVWGCGRCTIRITDTGTAYDVDITWGSSAWESTHWTYICGYQDDHLAAYGGSCTDIVYDDNGNETSTLRYSNGSAHFSIDPNGNLVWDDGVENAGDGMRFTR